MLGLMSSATTRHARVALGLAVAVAVAPAGARAAACCTSAASFGVGRLLAWEELAVGVQVGHTRSLGQFDAAGTLRASPTGFSDGLSQVMPWAIARVSRRVQVQGWAPYVVNDRRSGDTTQTVGHFGDVGTAVRLEAVAIGELQGLPSLAFTLSAIAPTGQRVEQTSPPLFAGTTGRGAWGGGVALEAEYAWLPWFVRVDAGAYRYLPFERPDTGQTQAYGALLAAGLSGGAEIVEHRLVGAVSLRAEREGALSLDGAEVPSSAARATTIAASLAWRFDPHWTATLAGTTTYLPDGWSAQRDARVGGTLGIRYGHF